MNALILNTSLKRSPQPSNTEALATVVAEELRRHQVATEIIRIADLHIPPGVTTDMGDGDQWPALHQKLLAAQILVLASPTWLGHPSSLAQRVLERMDAMISQTSADGRPVAFDRVAGVVVTGNEDGAHHVISELNGALIDIGYTVPAWSWTYWNKGPGPGDSYLDTNYRHDWSERTGRIAAANLVAVAQALQARPLPAPPQ